MNSRRGIPRTAKRTWAKLSETQRSVLEAATPHGPGDGRLFKSSRLRTARSIQDRGLLTERGPNKFTRTPYGQEVIDWKIRKELKYDTNE